MKELVAGVGFEPPTFVEPRQGFSDRGLLDGLEEPDEFDVSPVNVPCVDGPSGSLAAAAVENRHVRLVSRDLAVCSAQEPRIPKRIRRYTDVPSSWTQYGTTTK